MTYESICLVFSFKYNGDWPDSTSITYKIHRLNSRVLHFVLQQNGSHGVQAVIFTERVAFHQTLILSNLTKAAMK